MHGRCGLCCRIRTATVCIQWSGDRCQGLTSVSQQLVWMHLIHIYCWEYVQLVEYQTTATDELCSSSHCYCHSDDSCTVLYKALNMHLAARIGFWFQGCARFAEILSELTKTWSSGATECGVWIGNCNVKVWKSTEHKLHKIWRSLKFQQNEHTPGVDWVLICDLWWGSWL